MSQADWLKRVEARDGCDPDRRDGWHAIGCPKRPPPPPCTCKMPIGFGRSFRGFMAPDPKCAFHAPSAPQTTPAHEYGPGCTSGDCSVCGGWHCLSHLVGNDLSRLAGCPGPRTAPRPLILPQQDAYGEPLRTVAPVAPQTTPAPGSASQTERAEEPCSECERESCEGTHVPTEQQATYTYGYQAGYAAAEARAKAAEREEGMRCAAAR